MVRATRRQPLTQFVKGKTRLVEPTMRPRQDTDLERKSGPAPSTRMRDISAVRVAQCGRGMARTAIPGYLRLMYASLLQWLMLG